MKETSIADRLKDARARAGLTVDQVAEAVGVSRRTVTNWEHDLGSPDLRHAPDLLAVLKVSPHWLIFGREKRT